MTGVQTCALPFSTRHDGVEAPGKWLAQVLRGWLAYYAVPMSAPAITAFRTIWSIVGSTPSGDGDRSIGLHGRE